MAFKSQSRKRNKSWTNLLNTGDLSNVLSQNGKIGSGLNSNNGFNVDLEIDSDTAFH